MLEFQAIYIGIAPQGIGFSWPGEKQLAKVLAALPKEPVYMGSLGCHCGSNKSFISENGMTNSADPTA